jgi:hypothetical protein
MKPRLMTVLVAAFAALFVLARVPRGTADDDDDEKPITSSAAQVSRDAAGDILIAIRPAAQKEIGLAIETLTPVVRQVKVEAYGFALDPAPLSKLNSDLIGAHAAIDASEAQFRRSRSLYREQKNVSLRDFQAAQAAYLADQARLGALEQQLRDSWGREIAYLGSRARAELVDALIDRREAILRVTVPAGAAIVNGSPGAADIAVLGHERSPLVARAVYYAPTADPRMQGQSFLLLVDTSEFPVQPGAAVTAQLLASGGAEQGVMIPRAAVVRYAGREWVYQALEGDRFIQREIVPAQSSADGYFVTGSFHAGMRILVTGAETLLSEELKAQIHPED